MKFSRAPSPSYGYCLLFEKDLKSRRHPELSTELPEVVQSHPEQEIAQNQGIQSYSVFLGLSRSLFSIQEHPPPNLQMIR